VSVSVYAAPTDSLHQLAEFRVGMQARERRLASQLDEIRIVFPIGSLQPFERSLLIVDRSIEIIAAFAIPIFAAALWALRRMAPTRQRLVGFSAGCLAGAAAAGLYAIHCNETVAAFVVSWYTAGILLPALVGMLIGPRALHW
jgi:Negative regulator of sigma F